ncbi:MAG: hypothetical protein ACT4TC_24835 [Myxococcaceae bacterium]
MRGVAILLALCSSLLTACGTTQPGQGDASVPREKPEYCPVPMPTECPNIPVRYSDLTALISERCSVCHTGAVGGPWPLSDYQSVADWQDALRDLIRTCEMPPVESGIELSLEERTKFLQWVKCGALQ